MKLVFFQFFLISTNMLIYRILLQLLSVLPYFNGFDLTYAPSDATFSSSLFQQKINVECNEIGTAFSSSLFQQKKKKRMT